MDKTEAALAIIAGLEDPFRHWDNFYAKPRPERRDGEGFHDYRRRVGAEVRWMAIRHVAAKLDNR